jgi:hypothetical protein
VDVEIAVYVEGVSYQVQPLALLLMLPYYHVGVGVSVDVVEVHPLALLLTLPYYLVDVETVGVYVEGDKA